MRCEKCLNLAGGLEMTERNPCGKLSATNGVWYVTTGLLCFGNTM